MTDQQPESQPSWSVGRPGEHSTYGYGRGWEPNAYPPDPKLKSRATLAFVINIVACVLCCSFASPPGLICGGIAMSKADVDPESAQKLIRWSWICLGITLGIAVAVAGVLTFVAIVNWAEGH